MSIIRAQSMTAIELLTAHDHSHDGQTDGGSRVVDGRLAELRVDRRS